MSLKGIFYIEALVSDLGRSRSFYAETLGWKIHTDLPHVAGFYFGTGYLIILPDSRPPPSRPYAAGMHVDVQVEDVGAEHKRLMEKGVEVSELSDKVWDECKFSFSDPDGYRWSYGQLREINPPRVSLVGVLPVCCVTEAVDSCRRHIAVVSTP